MGNAKGGAVSPSRPPRIDDVIGNDDSDVAESRIARPAGVRSESFIESAEPASVLTGRANQGSFEREGREDDLGDRDRRSTRPRTVLDAFSERLGLGEYAPGPAFEWCRNGYGHKWTFSRRYPEPNSEVGILVDLFAADGNDTRREVASKRQQIEAHNVEAKANVAQMIERAKDSARKQWERLAASGEADSLQVITEREIAAGMSYLRSVGGVPFGYLPVIGFPKDVDMAALRAGAVLDLPPPPNLDDWSARGIGVSSSY